MRDSWACLMVENGPGIISDEVRTALKAAACNLHLKRRDTMLIVSDVVDGIIKTEWRTYSIGGHSGVLFRAQVDHEGGSDYQVNFLLNEQDLDNGAEVLREIEESTGNAWGTTPAPIPIQDLHQFYDLRAGASRTLN